MAPTAISQKFETTSLLLFVYIKHVLTHVSRGMFRQEREEVWEGEVFNIMIRPNLFAVNTTKMVNQTWDGRNFNANGEIRNSYKMSESLKGR
jgi:hypothetical protein